ncbi:MAG: hypothetical protein AUK36_04380 [Zetaproteobacteria bacterium CG2_30_59_37]|nr:MAG: hypothetical protein AUK36_04380 [Zetaproteobacteria bacterium CG2_30_59_37]
MAALELAACDASSNRTHTDYPDEQSEAFNVYARNCSECHAPPLPSAHPAEEWPNVIARMQQHLVHRSMAPIAVADILVLREYLETHAAGK